MLFLFHTVQMYQQLFGTGNDGSHGIQSRQSLSALLWHRHIRKYLQPEERKDSQRSFVRTRPYRKIVSKHTISTHSWQGREPYIY